MGSPDAQRTKELAAIHVAKKELRLCDEDYRATVERLTQGRTDSAGTMSPPERRALLAHFQRLGWGRSSTVIEDGVEPPFKRARKPQARLVWALWRELERAGALDNPTREACRAFCARTAGIGASTDPDLMTSAQLDPVIAALKAWVARSKEKPA
jgi:hypothetical protein